MEGCVNVLRVTERVYGNISPYVMLPFLSSRALDLRVQKAALSPKWNGLSAPNF